MTFSSFISCAIVVWVPQNTYLEGLVLTWQYAEVGIWGGDWLVKALAQDGVLIYEWFRFQWLLPACSAVPRHGTPFHHSPK